MQTTTILHRRQEIKILINYMNLQPMTTNLSERFFSVLQSSKNQTVDESMVKFKGCSSLKQYMAKKTSKGDIKYGCIAMKMDLHLNFRSTLGKLMT